METKLNSELMNKLTTYMFYFSVLLFLIAFKFQDNKSSGWYQQFLPNLGGKQITDITFIDSLNGYAVATQTSDSSYILKTTNGGDNWQIIYKQQYAMTRLQFLNSNTGYVCGGYLYKSTNGGYNWNIINTSGIVAENMYVLNQDTIWIIDHESLVGGVFLTTNGGLSWQQKFSGGTENPNEIYFYNANLGFISGNPSPRKIRRTTDGGNSWTVVHNNDYFDDMYFNDSLLGWKCSAFGMKKTTDGGLNWITQQLPTGGIISSLYINFSNTKKDTIWAIGGYIIYPNSQIKQVLFRTTNQGSNWYYQIPDTSIQIGQYWFINFVNKLNGWVTPRYSTEIHTTVGGDTTFLSSIHQISNEVPKDFVLYQNYPNPFNSTTNVKFQMLNKGNAEIKVFDITGKLIKILVDKKQSPGIYEVKFEAGDLSSGIYFYSLFVDGVRMDTKKAVLIK